MNLVHEVTVKSDEDIQAVIAACVLKHQWKDVYITGAVGSVIDMSFTTPSENTLPLKTVRVEVDGAAEVIAFTGEVMIREKMDPALAEIYPDQESPLFVHIHVGCAYKGGIVRGGGLAKGKAFRSLRVFMVPIEK